MNENNINYDVLIRKGILTSKNEISQAKINLISGAMTAPFLETVWAFSGHDTEIISRITDIFAQLYNASREIELLDILRILYGIVGMKFPEDVDLLITHSGARRYFLFSFLLDMDDCIQDFMTETNEE